MKGLKDFLSNNMPAMVDYLKEVSTPRSEHEHYRTPATPDHSDHGRIGIMNALRERKSHTPTLVREALLFPPLLQDVPKHLALLTSSVVRNAPQQRVRSLKETNEALWAFVKACKEVENTALKSVSQLRPRTHNNRPISVSVSQVTQNARSSSKRGDLGSGPSSPVKSENPGKRMMRRRANTTKASSRPQTAPSLDDPNARRSNGRSDEKPLPSPMSPSSENQPRSSSGSGSVKTNNTMRGEKRRSVSLDKNARDVDENQQQAWVDGPRGDADEGKGRMRFFKLLTRR